QKSNFLDFDSSPSANTALKYHLQPFSFVDLSQFSVTVSPDGMPLPISKEPYSLPSSDASSFVIFESVVLCTLNEYWSSSAAAVWRTGSTENVNVIASNAASFK